MSSIVEARFVSQLEHALERVRVILDAAKHPYLAADVHHQYDDKYRLAEAVTQQALASQVNSLSALGLDAERLPQLQAWAQTHAVSLRFRSEERCTFGREEQREVESPTKHVTEVSMGGRLAASLTSKNVTIVTEFFWNFDCSYELTAVRGVGEGPDDQMRILGRSGRHEIKTTTKKSPHPEVKAPAAALEVNASWLFRHLRRETPSPLFHVDREHAQCHTPRRNSDVDGALAHFASFSGWATQVADYLQRLFRIDPGGPRAVTADSIFIPVLPLLEDRSDAAAGPGSDAEREPAPAAEAGVVARLQAADGHVGSLLLGVADANRLIAEEVRSLLEKRDALAHPATGGAALVTAAEAMLTVTLRHCSRVCGQHAQALDYIEGMLRKQLIAAIGKEVTPGDFGEYMLFHNRRLFAEAYAPLPFCFAVRRSERHSPEGTLSIEQVPSSPAAHVSGGAAAATAGLGGAGGGITFSFALRKADGAELGLNVSHNNTDRVLLVEGIREKGAVEAWNKQCAAGAAEKAIVPGDRIISVNSMSYDPQLMLEECRKKQLLRLTVVRGEATAAPPGSGMAEPIVTLVARSARPHPMQFPLGASAQVSFGGDRYLHAWLSHRFSGQPAATLSLVSRARQFSSMLVLVGRIASADTFDPKYAAIVQNKDEVTMPLELSTIPTPKEFKDAIESLSPEQQRFAKAFRSMQLQSTLFGIVVIQIKPQLEKVLNLPADSLTKEIKLTQDLMQLFIKYQIPSDLLSFDSDTGTDAERLDAVRGHVRAMHEMLEQSKKEEVEERTREVQYADPFPVQLLCDDLDEMFPYPAGSPASEAPRASALRADAAAFVPWGFAGSPAADGHHQALNPTTPGMILGTPSDWGTPSVPPWPGGPAPWAGSWPGVPPHPDGLRAGAAPFVPLWPGAEPAAAAAAPPGELGEDFAAPEPMMAMSSAAMPPPAPMMAMSSAAMPPPAPPPPAFAPQARQAGPSPPAQPPAQQPASRAQEPSDGATGGRDYTQVPKEMDRRFEELDEDSALRPTIINPSSPWTKRAQKALLASPTVSTLHGDEQKQEKDAAFDLLDALTRSGSLSIDHASLHVVVAATHCFDKTLVETVIQDNANPIEKVERSTLIMATTIHQQPAAALIQRAQRARVSAASPQLFLNDGPC